MHLGEDVFSFACVLEHLCFIPALFLKVQRIFPNGSVAGRRSVFAPVGHRIATGN